LKDFGNQKVTDYIYVVTKYKCRLNLKEDSLNFGNYCKSYHLFGGYEKQAKVSFKLIRDIFGIKNLLCPILEQKMCLKR